MNLIALIITGLRGKIAGTIALIALSVSWRDKYPLLFASKLIQSFSLFKLVLYVSYQGSD